MSSPNSFDTTAKPKCARCRHHGIVTPKKGHAKICPFVKCQCAKCYLITERTKIAALQREMRKARKEQRPGDGIDDGEAASAPMGPPSGGAPGKGTPADPWRRPEPGGQPASGSDMGNALPSTSGKRPALDSPGFDEARQMAPLPFIPFPFKMPSHYPCSFPVPPPHLLPNMPWLPPVPVGFGPLMFPQLRQCAVNYPPPSAPGPSAPGPSAPGPSAPGPSAPGPPAISRQVLVIRHLHRDSESSTQQQHPPPPVPATAEQDAAEQDAAEQDAAEQVSGGE